MRVRLLGALLCAIALPLIATPVRVRVKQAEPSCAVTRIEATCDGVCTAPPVSWPVDRAGDLADDRVWLVRAAGEGCWSEELRLQPRAVDGAVELRVWRATALRARLMDGRRPLDHPSMIRVQSAGDSAPPHVGSSRTCLVEGDTQVCSIPSGVPIDVALHAPGFGPAYFFDVTAAGEISLGDVPVARGGSLTGRVDVPKDVTLDDVVVTAESRPTADAPQRSALRRRSATLTTKGLFQISDLSEGEYFVHVTKRGYSDAESELMVVHAGADVVLPRPLRVLPLLQLQVNIRPATDGAQRQWTCVLVQPDRQSLYVRELARGQSAEGTCAMASLQAGEYMLLVQDHDANVRHQSTVVLDDERNVVDVTVDELMIEGSVSAGNEPLPGTLTFRSHDGLQVQARTATDATYRTSMPKGGAWNVTVRADDGQTILRMPVQVDADARNENGYVRTDLAFPAGSIGGRVVDDQGEAIERAVIFARRDDREIGQAAVRAGRFLMCGLAEGPVELQATIVGKGQSEPLRVSIPEDDDVELVFRSNRNVTGSVTTADGRPIAGAIVRFFSPRFLSGVEAVTGMSGTFSVAMPQVSGKVSIVVLPGVQPARILAVDGAELRQRLAIVVPPAGGVLAVRVAGAPPWPEIISGGAQVPVTALLYPRDGFSAYPRGFTSEGLRLDLAPARYSVCLREKCQEAEIAMGVERILTFAKEIGR